MSLHIIDLIVRRHRRRLQRLNTTDIRKQISGLLGYFLLLVVLHVIAMMVFETLLLEEAIWLTLTTVTTVGYGDFSAQTTLGRIATIVLLYAGGIFILAKIAGDYFDYRLQRRDSMIKGQWRWRMQDHILIINSPSTNADRFFLRLVQQFRKNTEFADTPIQLLTSTFPQGLPSALNALDVLHYTATAHSLEVFAAVNVAEARFIIILAQDEANVVSDSATFDMIHRLKDAQCKAVIVAECVDDNNRQRFMCAGAQSVLRPVRAYPEIIARAIAAPGSEQVLENLFTHDGNHTRRYDLVIEQISWSKIVCQLINANLGTAMAYLDEQGTVHCNPSANTRISAKALFVLVQAHLAPSEDEMSAALAKI